MSPNEIFDSAYDLRFPPAELENMAEEKLWYAARSIYMEFRTGEYNKEECAAKKKKALEKFREDLVTAKRAEEAEGMHIRLAQMYADLEDACRAWNREPTVANGDALVRVIHGVISNRNERGE